MIAPHPHERPLRAVVIVASALFWLGLGLLGWTLWPRLAAMLTPMDLGLLGGAAAIVTYLAHTLIRVRRAALLLGHAVEVGPEQYPDLHARVRACAKRLGLPEPVAYLLQAPHGPLSDSLRYRGRDYLTLNAEFIGALTEHQGSIDFFIGYELARLHDPDRPFRWLLLPGEVLPLLGAAYTRAKTYTCDRHGIAACRARVDAALALAPLAAGSRRWKSFSIGHYAEQSLRGGLGFTFFELVSPMPYLVRRAAHLRGVATGDGATARRHPLAWIGAALVPRLGPGVGRAFVHLVTVLLWLLILTVALWHGHRHLVRAGWIEPLQSLAENRAVPIPPPAVVGPTLPPAPSILHDAYFRLDGDLKLLGEIANNRFRKLGGIPCEVGTIRALELHYPVSRYAFSCDEPLVYTVVETGEFEGGRAAHLRSYNWKERKFTTSLAPVLPPVVTEPAAKPVTESGDIP